ncbi:hypothetical protein EV126DRAFT_91067 [Verticillium dahliae]|nr:hypothetical protein EV126DRAFT_91067 [Verticillium dahliae]
MSSPIQAVASLVTVSAASRLVSLRSVGTKLSLPPSTDPRSSEPEFKWFSGLCKNPCGGGEDGMLISLHVEDHRQCPENLLLVGVLARPRHGSVGEQFAFRRPQGQALVSVWWVFCFLVGCGGLVGVWVMSEPCAADGGFKGRGGGGAKKGRLSRSRKMVRRRHAIIRWHQASPATWFVRESGLIPGSGRSKTPRREWRRARYKTTEAVGTRTR